MAIQGLKDFLVLTFSGEENQLGVYWETLSGAQYYPHIKAVCMTESKVNRAL